MGGEGLEKEIDSFAVGPGEESQGNGIQRTVAFPGNRSKPSKRRRAAFDSREALHPSQQVHVEGKERQETPRKAVARHVTWNNFGKTILDEAN